MASQPPSKRTIVSAARNGKLGNQTTTGLQIGQPNDSKSAKRFWIVGLLLAAFVVFCLVIALAIYLFSQGYPASKNRAPSPFTYLYDVDSIRSHDFKRLTETGQVYLDHAGSGLYAESDLDRHVSVLKSGIFGNPHSQSISSKCSEDFLEKARESIAEFFHTSLFRHYVIFTSGATAALKLVGESFPWTSDSHFVYTLENHNSVLGIREYTKLQKANFTAIPYRELLDTLISFDPGQVKEPEDTGVYHLFALPAECNFSGSKFNLSLIAKVKAGALNSVFNISGRWLVLLDAAKYVATSDLNLKQHAADFVSVSFYKIFGYPTGLGCLLVKHSAASLMRKTYFGGGTVVTVLSDTDFVKLKDDTSSRFEDGTTDFLGVAALQYGMERLHTIGMANVSRHVSMLVLWTSLELSKLRHSNGSPLVQVYSEYLYRYPTSHNTTSTNTTDPASNGTLSVWDSVAAQADLFNVYQGSIASFNILRPDGQFVGHAEVEKLAAQRRISIRGGCFCNPGACQKYLNLTHEDVIDKAERGETCSIDRGIAVEKPTGAVRVSFGYESLWEDAQVLVNFVKDTFTDQEVTGPSFPV